MEILYENLLLLDWRHAAMWVIGGVLIFLAIKKNMEPSLLLPIGLWRHFGQPAPVRRGGPGV